VNQKVKKEFQLEVRSLLAPLDSWLIGSDSGVAQVSQSVVQETGEEDGTERTLS